jgi:hypothetical protein
VTRGAVANRDLGQLIEPVLRALADTDALVVATTGRDDAVLGDVPANARVAAFVPYSALLPRASALVTNGGYGASLQALAHGVPLVIAGQSEDKAEVAARLAWTGAALNLATDAPRPPRPTSVPPSRRSPAAPPTAPTPSDCKPRSGGAVPSTRSLRPSPRSQATEAQHTKSAR